MPAARKPKPKPAPKAKPAARAAPAGQPKVKFSNVDKVMFPEAGVTKGDVLDFYIRISNRLLPHLRDRPVTLERLPDGIGDGKPRFWQKNTPPYYPEWIPRVNLPTEEGKAVQYALVNDVEALAYLVNQGTITFHPYLSRVQSLDRPDFVLVDLDPGAAKFADVVTIANALHGILDDEGVKSYPKTSGKSGLHVLVPWSNEGGYDAARAWATAVADRLVKALPNLATTERLKQKRGGRVYVDVVQNSLGHHAVPPYVLRATPGATVSTPLAWKEVTPKLDPKQFTVRTIFDRLGRTSDPLKVLTGT